jgi:RHS repeat-associated protein
VGIRSASLSYGVDSTRQKFTSKERDLETNLDYFLARYYSSTQGRFTSPDEFIGGPEELFIFAGAASANPTFYADLTNPQSLNKYQYTYNDPLSYTDPDGHCPVCPAYYYEYYVKPKLQEVDAKITQIKNDLASYGRGLGKTFANAVIDPANAYAVATGKEPIPRYEPDNEVEAMAMNSGDKLILLSGGLGKGVPVNVAAAEGKGSAVVAGGVARKAGGALTEPTLPAKTIVEQGGVKIVHYTASGDHGPAHLHVTGNGAEVRIGQNGKPLKNNPELSAAQQKVVNENKAVIRRAVDKIQRYHKFQNLP